MLITIADKRELNVSFQQYAKQGLIQFNRAIIEHLSLRSHIACEFECFYIFAQTNVITHKIAIHTATKTALETECHNNLLIFYIIFFWAPYFLPEELQLANTSSIKIIPFC